MTAHDVRLKVYGLRKQLTNVAYQLRSRRYARCGVNEEHLRNLSDASSAKQAVLVTIAFNQPDLIDLQGRLLKEFFSDSYIHVVADNSSDLTQRSRIQAVVEAHGGYYVSLPPPPDLEPSYSHGLALNWVCHNVLSRCRTAYIGLLDHDIFPYARVSYADVIALQGSYGHFQVAKNYKFYWPGLMFFDAAHLDPASANFLPTYLGPVYGDTGAGNWRRFYAKWRLDSLDVMTIRDVVGADPARAFHKTGDFSRFAKESLTLLDESWVHMINGSNWLHVKAEKKLSWVTEFIEERRGKTPVEP